MDMCGLISCDGQVSTIAKLPIDTSVAVDRDLYICSFSKSEIFVRRGIGTPDLVRSRFPAALVGFV